MQRRSVKYALSISLAGLCEITVRAVTKLSTKNVCSLTPALVVLRHLVSLQPVHHIAVAVLLQLAHSLGYTLQLTAVHRLHLFK